MSGSAALSGTHSPATWVRPASFRTAGSTLPGGLTDQQSLTRRLRSISPKLSVKFLGKTVTRPHSFERRALGPDQCNSVCRREVLLCSDNLPMVYAISIWPRLRRNVVGQSLRQLGCRPLGEALFRRSSVYRDPFVYKRLNWRHPILVRACSVARTPEESAWGRLSVVRIERFPLIVIEVFLNNFIATVRHQDTKLLARQGGIRIKY